MSRYAEKQAVLSALPPGVKLGYGSPRKYGRVRLCTKCGGKLAKPKGHGFVSSTGGAIYCGKCVK